jgi:FtsP/CotA-like multicopper oxidase with cupredoxin domain
LTTGAGPYVVPEVFATAGVLATTITVSQESVDIGGGVMANCEVLNGTIPGPTLRLNAGDTLIVRLVNELPHPSGIHWHGIELVNGADGTHMTQNAVPAGKTYLYKFRCPRPGLYWYHPHHHHSTNRVFRGTYGMIVVTDPNEASLIASGVLPNAAATKQLVLSDITVCKAPPNNDTVTYASTLPWLGPATAQPGPTPKALCETSPLREDGTAAPAGFMFAAGDVPNIQPATAARMNEGQTVLTNGVNVGGRAGTPSAPGALAAGAHTLPVTPGQGLRLQIVNCATTRYFRLLMTLANGTPVPLVRVGGEGGLLDDAIVEGGMTPFNWKYTSGEILLPPASRSDVVVAVPATATGVATIWTQDFQRTEESGPTVQNYANLPTVPVMHLDISGTAGTYAIGAGTALRSSIAGAAVETLGPPFGSLLNPTTGFTPPKDGLSSPVIQMTGRAGMFGIDSIAGHHEHPGPYTGMPKLLSARYARVGDTLELAIRNMSDAHHPFHLHGFSFQPVSLTRTGNPTYTWPYREFRDNIDLPANYTLNLRVRIDDRPLDDGVTMGGAFGRWLFHCHIFFHAHLGMTGELIITAPDGSERPYVDVVGSWAYAPAGGVAWRQGTYHHPDGDPVTLSVPIGTLTTAGTASSGTWRWELNTTGLPDGVRYVYITARDPDMRRDQAVFRLKIGEPDDGADNGDPHIHTVDGNRYDFQAVGEFVLLRDDEGMELQARQTPVATANPVTDPYSGLTSCVSVNTAVAARVGSHTISYQPSGRGEELQLLVDGKPARLGENGMQLGAHRVSSFDAGGSAGVRIDYAHHPVVTISPYFWSSHNLWLLNVDISHTGADAGVMGVIPEGSWLPRLSSGAALGEMPRSLHERYVQLYRTFADSWRVSDESSLFEYAPGTSTETFTDRDWPAESPPCVLKPQYEIPGAPVLEGVSIERAEEVCNAVTDDGLRADCVFDVATTGDEIFAKAYLMAQELRERATTVRVASGPSCHHHEEGAEFMAVVLPLRGSRPVRGSVRFVVDGEPVEPPVELDEQGRACLPGDRVKSGAENVQATYLPGDGAADLPSTSPVHSLLTEETHEPDHDHDHDGKHDHDGDHDHEHHDHSHHIKKAIWIALLVVLVLVVLYLLLA